MSGNRRRLGILLSLAPLFMCFELVHAYGVNMFVSDEFAFTNFVRYIRTGYWDLWFHFLVRWNNLHRMLPFKLVLTAETLFSSSWNGVNEMWLSAGVLAVELWLCWRMFRTLVADDPLAFAPLAFALTSLTQYANLLSGINMNYMFTALGLLGALWLLERPGRRRFAGAALCAVMAGSAIFNGVLAWVAGGYLLGAQRRWRALWIWSALGVAFVVAYFTIEYTSPSRSSLSFEFLSTPGETLLFAVAMLGGPLAGARLHLAAVMGALLLAAGAALAVELRVRRPVPEAVLPVALLLFGGLSAAMVAAGRIGYGLEWAVESRYISSSSLFLVGVMLLAALWLRRLGRRRLAVALGVCGALGLAAADLDAVHDAGLWRGLQWRQKLVLQSMDVVSDDALLRVCEFGKGAACRQQLKFLRGARLGPFADPPEVLVPLLWRQATPAEAIGPGQAIVEQKFQCTVSRLHDVGVTFAMYPSKEPPRVRLQLGEGSRLIASRTLLPEEVQGNRPAGLQVRDPVESCRGRWLWLRLEADESLDRAVTVWTYPKYVEGTLTQGGRVIQSRSLALSLNEVAYQVPGR